MSALFAAVFVLLLGLGLLGTLISLRLTVAGYGSFIIGLVTAAYYLGQVCGSFVAPGIVRRVGHIRAFATFAAMITIIALIHALYMGPIVWGTLRLATGIAMMGLYMVVESWLNRRSDSAVRGRVFSVYMVTSFSAIGAGQFLLNLGAPDNQTLFVVVGILLVASLIPVTLTRAIAPQPVKNVRIRVRNLLKVAPFGVWGCLGAGLTNGAFYALGPTFGIRIGLEVTQVAWLMGITIIAGMVLQWPVGSASDRFDRQHVIGLLCLAEVAACFLIIAVESQSLAGLLVTTALFGGIIFTIYPVAVAHVNDHIDASEMVPASAALILSYAAGAALGPLGAGGMMLVFGPDGLFAFAALVAFVLGLAALLTPRREPVAPQKHAPFVAMAHTSPMAAELDPRAGQETDSTEQTSS